MTFTYKKQAHIKGSKTIAINVSKDGAPHGQIWTYKDTRTESNPWHAKALSGAHRTFPKTAPGYAAAQAWIEQEA